MINISGEVKSLGPNSPIYINGIEQVNYDSFFSYKSKQSFKLLDNFKKNRENDLGLIDFKKNKTCIIHGLPKVGKSLLIDIWISQNKEYRVGKFSCSESGEQSYLFNDFQQLLTDLAMHSNQEHLIIIDDTEKSLDNSRLKNNIQFLISNLETYTYHNANLLLISWYDIKDKFLFKTIEPLTIKLFSYNIAEVRNYYLVHGYSESDFKKLESHFGGHGFILEKLFSELKDGTTPLDILLTDKQDILEVLSKEYLNTFSNISINDFEAFLEILVFQKRKKSGYSTEFKRLKRLNIIEEGKDDEYFVHKYISTLAYQFLSESNQIEKLASFILEKIDDDYLNENEIAFLFQSFCIISENCNSFKSYNELISVFKRRYKNDESFVYYVLSKNDKDTLKKLKTIKEIVDDDYYLYRAINYKSLYDLDRSLFEIEKFKQTKAIKGTFSEKNAYSYYFEKGKILKLRNPESTNFYEIEELYKKCLDNRGFLDLKNISQIEDEYSRKKVLKSYLQPSIELANLYVKQNFSSKAIDLLKKEYASLVNNNLRNSALFNSLGDFYQGIRDNETAIRCYEEANKDKKHYKSLFNLGKLYSLKKDYKSAHKYLRDGIENNLFDTTNYVIYRYYAVVIREVNCDYDVSIGILKKGLTYIDNEPNIEKRKKEKYENTKQLFITYIKKCDFDELSEYNQYPFGKDILTRLVQTNISELLSNVNPEKHIKIIDWLLQFYYSGLRDEIYNRKKEINDIYSQKVKYYISNDLSLEAFLEAFNNAFQPKIDSKIFNEDERKVIANAFYNILQKTHSFEQYKYYLLQFVIFSTDNTYKKQKLQKFFSSHSYDRDNFQLFQSFKNSCLKLNDLDFLRFWPQDETLSLEVENSFRYDFPKIAKIFDEQNKIESASKFWGLALKYEDNFQNTLDYTIFLIRTLSFTNFEANYQKCIFLFEQEQRSSNKDAKRRVRMIFTAILNTFSFKIHISNNIDYYELIEKFKIEISRIEDDFRTDLKLLILKSYYASNPLNRKIGLSLGNQFFWRKQYFSVLEILENLFENPNEDVQKKISICKKKIKLLSKEKSKNEGTFLSTYKSAKKYFEIGDYREAYSLYFSILNKLKNTNGIDIDTTLNQLIYSSLISTTKIDLTNLTNDLGILLVAKKLESFNYKKRAFAFFNKCCIVSTNIEYKVSCCFSMSKLLYENEKYSEAIEKLSETTELLKQLSNAQNNYNETYIPSTEDILFTEALIKFELKQYQDCFFNLNRVFFKTKRKAVLDRKESLLNELDYIDKNEFEYETIYSQALFSLSNFMITKNPNSLEEYYFFSEKSLKLNRKNKNIAIDFLEVYKMYKIPSKTAATYLGTNHIISEELDFNKCRTLGNMFKDLDEYTEALFYYNEMGKRCVRNDDYFIYNNNLALFYMKKREWQKAQTYLDNSLDYAKKSEENKEKYHEYYNKNKEEIAKMTKPSASSGLI